MRHGTSPCHPALQSALLHEMRCVPAELHGLYVAQAAQFPGASTAEGKGNAAGGPSEVRLRSCFA